MGRLEHEPVIHHFSHRHPLELINHNPSMSEEPAACAGCHLGIFGWIYGCRACDYYIDVSCAQLPPQISHGAHPNHTLSLYSSPVYPEGSFDCDACGLKGTGFCFHCDHCELDLHVTCAAKPLSFKHGGHHHPLALSISSPYGKKGFLCNVCGNPGSNQLWLYRCNDCEFDAHLLCVSTGGTCGPMAGGENSARQLRPLGHQGPQQPGLRYMQHFPGVATRSVVPGGPRPNHLCHQGMGHPGLGIPLNPLLPAPTGSAGLANGLVGNMAQEFLNGLAQQAGQNAMQAILGGDPSALGSGLAALGAVTGMN